MPDDESFARLVADWATDNGLCRTDAVVRLSGTPEFMEARRLHILGQPPEEVRQHLNAALKAVGRVPFVTLD